MWVLVIECEFCHKFFDKFATRDVFHHHFCLDCYRLQHTALISYLRLRPNSKLREFIDRFYFKTKGYPIKRKYLKLMKRPSLRGNIYYELDLDLHGN